MQENDNTNRVTIPIEIATEYTFESEADRQRISIDQISFYLDSIFYFMKMAVRGHDVLNISSDNGPLLEFHDLTAHTDKMCEIGQALAQSLTDHTMRLRDAGRVNIIDRTGRGTENPPTLNLAETLSNLIHSENLPEPLFNAIQDGLVDMFNWHVDQEPFVAREHSPEFIQMLLDNYTGPKADDNAEVEHERS